MIVPVILLCRMCTVSLGFDDVPLDESALMVAISREIDESTKYESDCRTKHEAIRAAGGYSAAATKIYVDWLSAEFPPYHWTLISHVLIFLRETNGDRSVFREPVVKLLGHEIQAVSADAVHLLKEIGTEADAAAVAAQLKRTTRNDAYYHDIIATLMIIGTEKEIKWLEAERRAGLLKDNPRFWARVDECEKAVRERVAKKKDKDLKANPPEKK